MFFMLNSDQPQVKLVCFCASVAPGSLNGGEGRWMGKQLAFSFCCPGPSQPSACNMALSCLPLERSAPCSPFLLSSVLSAMLSTSPSPWGSSLQVMGSHSQHPTKAASYTHELQVLSKPELWFIYIFVGLCVHFQKFCLILARFFLYMWK